MLLEIAIGDAYGAGFEYVNDRRFIRKYNHLTEYVKHPHHRIKPGAYTDDAQMSIAIAELILDRTSWSPSIIADKFLEAFHRDKRNGYTGRFYGFLKKTRTGEEFIKNIKPKSDKSGAAMRACPIGIFPSLREVKERSEEQAKVTHNTPDGINAAIAASLMTHYFIYDLGKKEELSEFLGTQNIGRWDEPWRGEVGSRGWMSVTAAITSIIKNDSLSSILKSCISWMGDVDTVAAIALGAASCSKEVKNDLPDVLIKKLENKTYGKDFLIGLDKKLFQKIKRLKHQYKY
jgi:ADP-ribosylglycohydrolase